MNKSMSMLIVGVILLAMSLIAFNQTFSEKSPENNAEQTLEAEFNSMAESSTPAGGLLPLDNGTLKNPSEFPLPAMDASTPVTDQSAQTSATTSLPDGQSSEKAPAEIAAVPQLSTPEPAKKPVRSTQTAPSTPTKADTAKKTSPSAEKERVTKKEETKQTPAKTQKNAEAPQIKTRMTVSGKEVRLRLTANAALSSKSFVLAAPDRIVLDLTGVWTVEDTKVPSNTLVKGVRVGRQGSNTRIVVDLLKPVVSYNVAKVNAKALELRIK